MRIIWKQTAVQSLISWMFGVRKKGWSAIAEHLVEIIESYFYQQDASVFLPGRYDRNFPDSSSLSKVIAINRWANAGSSHLLAYLSLRL